MRLALGGQGHGAEFLGILGVSAGIPLCTMEGSMPGMSVHFIALLSVALTGGLTGQDPGKTQRLELQNRVLSKKLAGQTREIATLKARIAALTAARAKPAKDRPKAKVEAIVRVQRDRALAQRIRQFKPQPVQLLLQPRVQFRGVELFISSTLVNPLLTHAEYTKALAKFNTARASLGKATDPAAARKIVDEMNRLLLDVRRALWEIEQKRKAAEKTAGEEKKK